MNTLVNSALDNSLNLMDGIGGNILKGQRVVDAVMQKPTSNDYWDTIEANLLLAVVMHFCSNDDRTTDNRNLNEVYSYLKTNSVEDIIKAADELPQNNPAYVSYSLYKSMSRLVQEGAKNGLITRLHIFLKNSEISGARTLKRMVV